MHIYEQLVFGGRPQGEGAGRTVLGKSPGVTEGMAEELVKLCEGWGEPPALGLEHPALFSLPLEAASPTMAGRLQAVVRVGRGLEPLFHAAVLSDQSFTSFFRNPYAFARSITWIEEWKPGHRLVRGEANADPERPLVTPPAGPGEMGLVDEALLKYLVDGRLHLPLERPGPESDRCLAILIACLPEKDRKSLRFASFATHEGNDYGLAAMDTENCHFAGWRRILSTWIAGDYVDETEQYVAAIREYLPRGDLAGITRVSMRTPARPGSTGGGLDVSHSVTPGTRSDEPAPRTQAPRLQTTRPQALRPAPTPPAAGSAPKSAAQPRKPAPAPRRPTGPMPAAAGGAASATGAGTTARRTPPPTRRSRPRRNPRPRVSRWPLVRVGALSLVLCATVFTGINWLDGKTLAESWEWARLPGWMSVQVRTERAPTLLEVVDVGMVYDGQLGLVTGKSGLGFRPSEDQGRRRAMANLREEAALPLEAQVGLFDKLAADGIQQGSRPDREIQRMDSLVDQGRVILNEIARLELAYYSLASATYWQDLGDMDDAAVAARRDSLLAADKRALEDACASLWTVDPGSVLADAMTSVEGMSSLLHLFEAGNWSESWEKKVAAAAGKVSPRASTMTRAYRNSAFAFLRIKKAERKAAHANLPFRSGFKDGGWPSPEVAAALPTLRAQTRNFESGHVPAVLAGVLDLYVKLKNPATLADRARHNAGTLGALEKNAAFLFHPDAYRPFLERVRFEAVVAATEGGADPTGAPGHLGTPGRIAAAIAFRDTLDDVRDPAVWTDLAGSLEDPFLAAWAGYHGRRAGAHLAKSQAGFDAAWVEIRKSAVELQEMVREGDDWSARWRDLDAEAQRILSAFATDLAIDPERTVRMEVLVDLKAALRRPLPLAVQTVTVRLDQDRMATAGEVLVAMEVRPGTGKFISRPVPLGPAAPAGTGWVGTVSVDWETTLDPGQELVVRVSSPDGETEYLAATCAALTDGGGPGSLSRPLAAVGGSVGLRMDPGYWKGLRVTDLGVIF